MPLKLEIVTPEGVAFKAEAHSVVLPTRSGEIGILPGHIPLVTMIAPGELDADLVQGGRTALAVDKGFAEIRSDAIVVMTEAALKIEAIDLAEAESARARAEAALRDAKDQEMDPEEVERLEATVRFAVARQLARKKHL